MSVADFFRERFILLWILEDGLKEVLNKLVVYESGDIETTVIDLMAGLTR